jgi:beta-lactam-binding protein with PASTA domain
VNAFFERVRGRISALTPGERRTIKRFLGVAAGAFILGYAFTALSFRTGGAPTGVVLVPDVRDRPVAEARRAMEAEDLTVVVGDSFPNAMVPAGAVLTQSPLPGREVSPGTEVRLILSTGPVSPTVPQVGSMTVSAATMALQNAGFSVVVEQAAAEGQPGRIISTQPAAGTRVPLPATVRIQVAGPRPRVAVPTLIGMLEEDAREMVSGLGLELGEVVYEESEFGEPGSVTSQEPAPGDSVNVGTPVRIRVTARTSTQVNSSLSEPLAAGLTLAAE